MPLGYCLREGEGEGLGDQPPWLLLGLESLGLGSSCPPPPRDLSCGGVSPFRPVSAPPTPAPGQLEPDSPTPCPLGPEGKDAMQAEGEPWDQGQGTRCLGQDPWAWGSIVAPLLPVLALLSYSLSTLCEMGWGSFGAPLCFHPISGSGEGSGGPLCPFLQPPPSFRQSWCLS